MREWDSDWSLQIPAAVCLHACVLGYCPPRHDCAVASLGVGALHMHLHPARMGAVLLQDDGQLKPVLLQPPSTVLWSPIHPEPQDLEAARSQHPLYFDPALPGALRVEVNAGEVLYLPAMW